MSNQLQITGGAKVRDLNDVIIGTNGVLSSLAFNVANGVPKLDSNGKILVSQLPNSVMEYLGTWNAATNTPYLVNGVGNAGDVYLVSVAGTHDFGAGPITFAVSDQVIYSGSIWQKASGASGTVTSVGLSTSGNAFTIGSSPVTTSGTITINGAGTASQYINGAGNLTTFPTLITSIGLSMPSAFSVSNSPLTANGTISVTGAGTVSQYIDGTGALQSFPSLTGYVPYVGATTDVDLGVHVLNAQALHVKGTAGAGHLGLKHQTATPTGSANESLVFANVDGDLGWQNGNLYSTILNTHSNTANRVYTFPDSSGTIALTSDLSNYVTLGTNQTISGSKTFSVQTNFNAAIYVQNAQPLYLLNSGNTYQIGLFASLGLSGNRTIYFPNADGTLALTSQLTSGTVTFVAALTLGTSGTDLNSTVANSTTTPVITLNVPDASATARGVITTGTQTIAGGKTFSGFASFQSSSGTNTQYGIYLGKGSTPTAFSSSNVNIYSDVTTNNLVIRDNLSTANLVFNNSTQTYTFPASTGTIALTSDLSSYVPTTRTISTTAPLQGGGDLSANRTLSITQATTSTNGYLSSTDWNTFNGKQNALTNPVTGTGTSGQVTYFNGTTSVTGSSNHFWDATNNRLGINTATPTKSLDVNGEIYVRSFASFNSTDVNGWYASFLSSGSYFAYMGSTAQFAAVGGTATDFGLRSQNALAFYTGGGNERFRISSTGAATFSSSVTTGGDITIPNGNYYYAKRNTGGSAIGVMGFAAGSDTLTIKGGTSGAAVSMQFQDTAGPVMSFYNGNVGIGTSSPVATLHLKGSGTSGQVTGTQIWENGSSGTLGLEITGAAGSSYASFKYGGGPGTGTNGLTNALAIKLEGTGAGNVIINGTTPAYPSTNRGNLTITGTASSFLGFHNGTSATGYIYNDYSANLFQWYSNSNPVQIISVSLGVQLNNNATSWSPISSDERTKKNFETTQGLIELLQIEPVKYHFIEEDDNKIKRLGFKAQNLKPLIPEMVYSSGKKMEDGSDILTITPDYLLPVLVKAIQEQNQLIEDLKSRLDKAGL